MAVCAMVFLDNPNPDTIFRATVPTQVHVRPDTSAQSVADLIAGHGFTVLSYSEDWVRVQARAGTRSVTGYVAIQHTNFGI